MWDVVAVQSFNYYGKLYAPDPRMHTFLVSHLGAYIALWLVDLLTRKECNIAAGLHRDIAGGLQLV